jgi:hypothetical protein
MKKSATETRGLVAAMPSIFLVENALVVTFFFFLGESPSEYDPLSEADRVKSSELVVRNRRNPGGNKKNAYEKPHFHELN